MPAFLKLQTSQTAVMSSLLRLSPQNFRVGGPAVALEDAGGRVRDEWGPSRRGLTSGRHSGLELTLLTQERCVQGDGVQPLLAPPKHWGSHRSSPRLSSGH